MHILTLPFLFNKMAWNSNGERIRETLKDYFSQLKPDKKQILEHHYDQVISPIGGEWTRMGNIAFVTLKNRSHVLENLGLSVFKEAIGIGPDYYCIIRSYNYDFESLLLLALHYLPKCKFCMYPEEETLAGPFLHSPWSSLGRSICSKPTISIDEYILYLTMKAAKSSHL